MICFRDMTFCNFHANCAKGETCPYALTEQVKADAEKWWPGVAPIAVFTGKPRCHEEKQEAA